MIFTGYINSIILICGALFFCLYFGVQFLWIHGRFDVHIKVTGKGGKGTFVP